MYIYSENTEESCAATLVKYAQIRGKICVFHYIYNAACTRKKCTHTQVDLRISHYDLVHAALYIIVEYVFKNCKNPSKISHEIWREDERPVNSSSTHRDV